ncbi:Shikimate kinase, putative isoform 1 [Hibiscus syriacus]|uniref:Shikimate kinase, putative isoform 1 n=1 Tax=Hibiscus syriacus TaxID=106335 RepID=A0A6A3AM09_HIBSY|nr:Shikimate kinase, putative isoform 1 [Hibiscus syriacus]
MKSSWGKLRRFALHKNDGKDKLDFLSFAHLDELAQAAKDMQDMRNYYDSLLLAAAATANSAYGRILLMLGNLQFELRNSNVYEYLVAQQREKGRSKSGKGETFTLQQLQTGRDEYDEVATLCVFRLKSLKQGQSRSLVTQAARHHAVQLNFFKKGLKSLEAVEPHVRQVTEQQHIDYQFCGIEDDGGEDGEIAYDPNKEMENAEVNPEKSHGDIQLLHKVGSHSASIFPERKLDPAERVKQKLQSSTRRSHAYVLPTPNDSTFAASSRTSSSFSHSRSTNVAGHPHNLWHSSPLEQKNHEKDSGDGQSSKFTILNSESILKENSSSNNTTTQLPPPLTEGKESTLLDISSEAKNIKRKSVSGPLTSKQLLTKPVFQPSSSIPSAELPSLASALFSHLTIPRSLSPPKVSPSASPPLVSSPRLNELHELPRPPDNLAAKSAKPLALSGHSASLISSNIPSPAVSGASRLLAIKAQWRIIFPGFWRLHKLQTRMEKLHCLRRCPLNQNPVFPKWHLILTKLEVEAEIADSFASD